MNYVVNGTRFHRTGRQVRRADGYTYTRWSWVTAASETQYRRATAAEARSLNATAAQDGPPAMSLPGVHPSYRV